MLDAVVLEHLPGKALIWAHFELDLAKGARLHQALPHEEALVFRLFVDFIWKQMKLLAYQVGKTISKLTVFSHRRILWPLDSIEHKPFELFLLLGAAFYDDHVDVLVDDHHTGQQQLFDVRLNLELFGRIVQVEYSINGDVHP